MSSTELGESYSVRMFDVHGEQTSFVTRICLGSSTPIAVKAGVSITAGTDSIGVDDIIYVFREGRRFEPLNSRQAQAGKR